MDFKICTKCKEIKSVDLFYNRSTSYDGKTSACKDCHSKYKQEYRKRNPNTKTYDRRTQSEQEAGLYPSLYDTNKNLISRRCRECGVIRSASEYYNHHKYECKDCQRLRNKTINRFRRFNITWDDYNIMRKQQNYCCAICQVPEENPLSMVIDHDHNCCPERARSCGQCVRGLTCSNCNCGIGYLNESPELLLQAFAYLISYNEDHLIKLSQSVVKK